MQIPRHQWPVALHCSGANPKVVAPDQPTLLPHCPCNAGIGVGYRTRHRQNLKGLHHRKEGGITPLDLAGLPPALRKIMRAMLREIHANYPRLCEIVEGMPEQDRLSRAELQAALDELKKPYVTTARAKGLSEARLILKYPVRVAINPLVSTIGWTLPELISGIAITAVVLNLPTSGPLLLGALLSQDMHLAGSFIMLLSVLTVVGTLLSDILLAWVDPRIRFGARQGV
jgi:peptide/nickel transport system permease protein